MKCPNCNSPVEQGDTFCEVCGASLAPKKTSRLPVVIVSLVLFLGILGGIAFWVVSGDSPKAEEKELTAALEAGAKADDKAEAKEKTSNKDADAKDKEKSEDKAEAQDKEEAKDGADTKDGEEAKDAEDKTKENGEQNSQKAEEQQPVYESSEGGIHRYEYVISDCTWTEAYQKCLEAGGYLVRINSQVEFEHIVSEIKDKQMQNIQFRIGGRRENNSQDYYWVDESNQLYGEKINSDSYWCKNLWMSGEPSFSDKDIQETCLDMFYYKSAETWVWNDVPDDIMSTAPEFSGKIGYICEYEN